MTDFQVSSPLSSGGETSRRPLSHRHCAQKTGERDLRRHRGLAQLLFISGLYALWVTLFRLLTLTLITYFSISPTTRFQDISDVFGSNEVTIMGLASLTFMILIHEVHLVSTQSLTSVFNRRNIETRFLPGFVQGCIFGGGIVVAFLLTGNYRYLGSFIQAGEAPLEVAGIFLKILALASLAFCEEFIFRNQIARYASTFLSRNLSAVLTGLIYCSIKLLQFDLGISQLFTLFLLSLSLFYRAKRDGTFARPAGFWAGILILFHPILSLPVFGNDFAGVLLLKLQVNLSNPLLTPGIIGETSQMTRILTGGAGGPLSSAIFQLLLLLDVGRSILMVPSAKQAGEKEKGN